MSWLWIVLIVFVALAPLISLMPTRRQKRLADIRQAAAVAGLQVQLLEPPGPELDKRLSACYGLRAQHRQRLGLTGKFVREGDSWRNLDRRGAPLQRELTAGFPSGVSHLVLRADSVMAFWDEGGEVAEVETMKQALESLLRACSSAGN